MSDKTPAKEAKTFTCLRCNTSNQAARLPREWKLVTGGCVCKTCKAANYVQRVVSLPVVEIVTDEKDVKPWTPFKAAWDLATSLTNWCQIELLKHDKPREPQMVALPKFNRKMFAGRDLYGHWNERCPFRREFDGATGSAASLFRAIESRWRSHPNFGRFAVLWKRDSASPVARWPQPWVVRQQDWKAYFVGSEPHLSLTVPGGRVVVRLDSSSDWRRDLRRFRQILDGTATGGDLKVCAKFRDSKLVGVMVRISAMFEVRDVEKNSTIEAEIRTSAKNLLEIRIPGREPFVFCGDNVVGKQAAYDRWRARAAIDMKHEKRWPKRKRKKMVLSNQQCAINAQNRVKTAIEQLVSMAIGHEDKRNGRIVPGYLVRNRVAIVTYDDTCKEFVRRFEWHTMKEKMEQRCAELGIRFIDAGGEQAGDEENPEPAREV